MGPRQHNSTPSRYLHFSEGEENIFHYLKRLNLITKGRSFGVSLGFRIISLTRFLRIFYNLTRETKTFRLRAMLSVRVSAECVESKETFFNLVY